MKVVLVAPGVLSIPVVKYGGIERVIWNLACGFRDKGYKVEILARKTNGYTDKDITIIDPLSIKISDSVAKLSLREYPHHSKDYVTGVLSYLDESLSKEDFVFLNHSEQRDMRRFLDSKGFRYHEVAHYRNFSGSSNIVFPSQLLKSIFFYKSGVVIPHPTSFSEFYVDLDSKALIEGDYLLCVGRVCKNKRTKLALKLATELGYKCVIAGPIHDRKYASEFIDDCIYMGECDSRQLRNLYSNAQVSACLTDYMPPETFGLFQVEAMACGSTVISSKSGGLKDTFDSDYCVEYSFLKGVKDACNKYRKMKKNLDRDYRYQVSRSAGLKFSSASVVDKYIEYLF